MTWMDAIRIGVALTIPTIAYVTVREVLSAAIDYFWFANPSLPPSE